MILTICLLIIGLYLLLTADDDYSWNLPKGKRDTSIENLEAKEKRNGK
jgi:hypothetical protein